MSGFLLKTTTITVKLDSAKIVRLRQNVMGFKVGKCVFFKRQFTELNQCCQIDGQKENNANFNNLKNISTPLFLLQTKFSGSLQYKKL